MHITSNEQIDIINFNKQIDIINFNKQIAQSIAKGFEETNKAFTSAEPPFKNKYEVGLLLSRLGVVGKADESRDGIYVLLHLLQVLNMDNPRALTLEIQAVSSNIYKIARAYSTVRVMPVTLIMEGVLSNLSLEQEQEAVDKAKKDIQPHTYQYKVLISALNWFSELFPRPPEVAWQLQASICGMTEEEKKSLKRILIDPMRPDVLCGEDTSELGEGQGNLSALWDWFARHRDPVVQFVFKIARLGVQDYSSAVLWRLHSTESISSLLQRWLRDD